MAPRERQKPPGAVDLSLKGWVFVVLSGQDGLIGKIVAEGDARIGSLYTKLFPVYSIGSFTAASGTSDKLSLATIHFANRLEEAFDIGRVCGVPINVKLDAFAFLEDLSDEARKRIAAKIDETERAYEAQRNGLVAV